MPSTPSGPVTVSPSLVVARPAAPNRGSRWRSASPAWVVRSGQPGTVTRPPVTTAAARNGAALDRSGSMASSPDVERPRLDPPGDRRRRARRARRPRAASRRSCRCAAPDGSLPPTCRTSTPSAKRGRGEQQRADELRGLRRVEGDAAAEQPAAAVHGERQPVVGRRDVGPEVAQRPRPRGRAAAGGTAGRRRTGRRRRRAPRPAAGSASRCRRCRRRPSPGRPAAPG